MPRVDRLGADDDTKRRTLEIDCLSCDLDGTAPNPIRSALPRVALRDSGYEIERRWRFGKSAARRIAPRSVAGSCISDFLHEDVKRFFKGGRVASQIEIQIRRDFRPHQNGLRH